MSRSGRKARMRNAFLLGMFIGLALVLIVGVAGYIYIVRLARAV